MSERTWSEHLAWCKGRALAYLPHDPAQAISSMASDLQKHPGGPTVELISGLVLIAMMDTNSPFRVRRWIEGWN